MTLTLLILFFNQKNYSHDRYFFSTEMQENCLPCNIRWFFNFIECVGNTFNFAF